MKTFIVSVLVIVSTAGCCKVYCDGTELGLGFRKFSARDTDTVLFIRYAPRTDFRTPLDTFRIQYASSPTDTGRSSVAHSVSSSFDWKIDLPSLNQHWYLANFELGTERCQCGGRRYKTVRSFTANGQRKEGLYYEVE